MADRFPLKKLLPLTPERLKRAQQRWQLLRAQRREIPKTLLELEPRPLSAYDDNPVFDATSAARFLGISSECLKKWRQRGQGPDYIQYGKDGPVRYELNTLRAFRLSYTIDPTKKCRKT